VEVYNQGFTFFQTENLPPGQSSWTIPVRIPNGTNTFNVQYVTNTSPPVFVATTPLSTNLSQPISGWSSTSTLETDGYITFATGAPGLPSSGHMNVAHYTWDDNTVFTADVSGHGNDITSGGYSGGPTFPPYTTNDAVAGPYAAAFPQLPGNITGYLSPPSNVLAVLAGSFTVSAWVKTTQSYGNDFDNAPFGVGIITAYNGDYGFSVIPMGLTGSRLAFFTAGGSQDTLHSQSPINTGSYTHVAVTRDQSTGEKRIYINGVLEASDFGSTDLLDGPNGLEIGAGASQAFLGEVDDVQFYSGVLSSNEVATLFHRPGATVPDVGNPGPVAHYDFDEGDPQAVDVSGNGHDIMKAGSFGGVGPTISTADPKAGSGAVLFDENGTYLATSSSNLLATLADTFTVSLWLKTSQGDTGNDGDPAYNGAGLVSAFIDAGSNDLLPMALTGNTIAFDTGGDFYDTLTSNTQVNDDVYHHVVVTRNRLTGEKQIFIDGVLDNSDVGATNLLNDPQLLTIGALADASNPDPTSPDGSGYNGYGGLVDDVQIYNRVLSADDVTFLYQHPGLALAGSISHYPVNIGMQMEVVRAQDPASGDTWLSFVSFLNQDPSPTTTNRISSPNGAFWCTSEPTTGTSSSYVLNSLAAVLQEATNGLWHIYINEGSSTQQVYSFQVSITGLTTNLIPAAQILTPATGSTGVSPNTAFTWTGPANFTSDYIQVYQPGIAFEGSTNVPATFTTWPNPPVLNAGTNRFELNYSSNNVPGLVTFTTPLDNQLNPMESWNTVVNFRSTAASIFVVSGSAGPLPVSLSGVQINGGNFQFSFPSQNGFTYTLLSRTNVALGNWVTNSSQLGDGGLKSFSIPKTNSQQYFRLQEN